MPCSAQPPAVVGVKVRACAVADIVHNGNAAEAEQRDNIAGGKSPGPALPEVARVVELLPDAAPVRAEGNDLYIGIVRRFNARRGDNFDKARRDDAVQRGEQLDGIALDARKALGKNEPSTAQMVLDIEYLFCYGAVGGGQRTGRPTMQIAACTAGFY